MARVAFKVLGIRFRSRQYKSFLPKAKGGGIVDCLSTSHIDEWSGMKWEGVRSDDEVVRFGLLVGFNVS